MNQLSFNFGPHRNFLDATAANEAKQKYSLYQERRRDKFYASAAWRRVRANVLARDGARCKICGATPAHGVRIDVDHILPRFTAKHLSLYMPNLQVLCEECHDAKTYKDGLRIKLPERNTA